jgi:hypothetical protein
VTTNASGVASAGSFTANLTLGGPYAVTAASAGLAAVSFSLSNTVGVTTHYTVSGPSLATAGAAFSVGVTAQDTMNNAVTDYAGTVHFTSSDGAAMLPANSTLTNGTGTFSVTLSTTGNETVTATDTIAGSITGTSGVITVAPVGPAALSGIITNKAGAANTRAWTVTVANGGPGAAYNARLDALTLTQTAGAACTPVVAGGFPVAAGNVAPSSSGPATVTIDFTGCTADVQFRADLGFSANAGADTGSRTLYHQFQ